MRYLNYLLAVLMAALLAACGGGGGSSGSSGGGNGGPSGQPTIAVVIMNGTAQVSSISVGGAFTARATVRDGRGALAAGKLVSFSVSDANIATVAPTSALTNANGVAEVSIAASSVSAVGAATLTAGAVFDTQQASGTVDFAVSASSLALSPIAFGATSLPSGGNTTLSTTALIGGSPSTSIPVNVSFSASCGRVNGQDSSAGGVSVTTNGSGVATASYTAVTPDGGLCSGAVSVTASSAGATAQSGSITVAAPVANALTFVSATPDQIFVAGSGATEQSVALFRVLSSAGTPLAGVQVRFSIATNPGGVGLGAAGVTQPVTVTSNEEGEASVSLFSGTIPGPVKLRAELVGSPQVFTESQNLTVASGPPSQRFMSLSSSVHSLEGWNVDGVAATLTVRLADRQGNPVDDGTVVNFTAEGGQVARSCATARVNGVSLCSVDFITQNPRPAGGRVTIMAHTSGTKDYVDVNGNNVFDPGVDQLAVMGDAYRDDNENNVADVGEFYVPRGGTGACPSVGGAFPSKENTCDNGLATTVRQQAVLLFASSQPLLGAGDVSIGANRSSITVTLRSRDNPLLPMPAETVVTATSSNDACQVKQVDGSPIANVIPHVGVPGEDLATKVRIGLEGCAAGNSVSIRVTAPEGLVTSFAVSLP